MSGKLYWRIKKNGKWTWLAAEYLDENNGMLVVYKSQLEEEE